jgi:hypothetical protein
MDFSYPDTTQALADTIKKWGGQLDPEHIDDLRAHGPALHDLGVFAIASNDGPDPDNANLNSVVALETLAM